MEYKQERLVLIDADYIAFLACYNKKDAIPKTLDDVYSSVDDIIKNILFATKADKYIGALTMSKCFRYRYNSQYKIGRAGKIPMDFLTEAKNYMLNNYNIHVFTELEADDVLCICKKNYKNAYDVIIASPDKDLLNLEGCNYDYKNNVYHNITLEQEKRFFFGSMISGDNVDSIKGIPGKGDKFVDKLFNSLDMNTEYYTAVFNTYLDHFGEEAGIKEFYKNYMCLKIVDSWPGFIVPEPYKVKMNEYKEKNSREEES